MRKQRDVLHILLDSGVTKGANYSKTPVDVGLDRFSELIATLSIESAERDTGNETYDFYITVSDGVGSWDIVHFPQIATTGAKKFVARLTSQNTVPQNVTTASPGVAANDPAILQVDTAGAQQGIKTLGAGLVRHAPWGCCIGYELVAAGTIATGVKYSIQVQAR